MGKQFETRRDAEVPATPQQVWDAIATGPGISSWFVGRTEVDGDTVRTAFGDGLMPSGTVTTADEPHRFSFRRDLGTGGRFVAYEYLVEGRAAAATVLRTVTSGFLPGDDWAEEFEAMRLGEELFFHTLAEHLRHFPGRAATPVTVFGPPVTDWAQAWHQLFRALNLSATPRAGDRVSHPLIPDGVVYHTNPQTLGIRTPDALLRIMQGFHGSFVVAGELDTWPQFLTTLERHDA